MLLLSLALLVVIIGWLYLRVLRPKNIDLIVAARFSGGPVEYQGKRHILFCFVDHFEPARGGRRSQSEAIECVREWRDRYPGIVDGFRDNSGRPPQHVFFYPQDEYIPECADTLAELVGGGYGSVEIHMHHDGDTSDGFREKIVRFKEQLHDTHGLLHKNARGEIEYGFIHGNWALDDSGVGGRWCGVRDEINVLRDTGCYADFTYPSAPHPTQPPVINRIYYATDDPRQPKSHHRGVNARYGNPAAGDLLLINGPLCLRWGPGASRLIPSIENGDITGQNPPTPDRVDAWVRTRVGVEGWPAWTFVKIHTHGATRANAALLLGERTKMLYERLVSGYNDDRQYVLHFVTAREMYGCVKALESGDRSRINRIEAFDYEEAPD